MGLQEAHEGYEYQDLLIAYFLLKDMLEETNGRFLIDRKESKSDSIDDVTIITDSGKFKRQVKYSNSDSAHTLKKDDLSSGVISIDELFQTWLINNNSQKPELRLCLAWNCPDNSLKDILTELPDKGTFKNFNTKTYQINVANLWPENDKPLSSWVRFNRFVGKEKVDRNQFISFCTDLYVEVEFPKFSLDLKEPGELESIVIGQVRSLGIGMFPNSHIKITEFAAALILEVKRVRSKGGEITSYDIFNKFNINQSYGSIEQIFPVIEEENVDRTGTIKAFIESIKTIDKVLLLGEPGNGKSWFIQNVENYLRNNNYRVIKHYCYTDVNDTLQKNRIQTNTFFGNLIADIIDNFPNLRYHKKVKYGSDLSELNHLLELIDQDTVLIIDGLDHIDRVFHFKQFHDLSVRDIDIIKTISCLSTSRHVKVIIASQAISDLNELEGFEKKNIPAWGIHDTRELMLKVGLSDIKIESNLLADFLQEKCNGNPLYLKYLISEIKQLNSAISAETINELPAYSYNLKDYYQYILNKIQSHQDVPRILSGVGFSLTQLDLKEITHLGMKVDEDLKVLSPILNINILQSGYQIYHESFRRFIVEHLESAGVNIEAAIFRPIIDWFSNKDFFSHTKAFRFYLQLLHETRKCDIALKFISHDFITKSIICGQPWKAITNNYLILARCAVQHQDFPAIVMLNELNKILSTTIDSLDSVFIPYLTAIGNLYGFAHISQILLFDGKPTLDLIDGLKACYLCNEHNTPAPWVVYMQYFEDRENITEDTFKYFVRGLVAERKADRLNKVATKLNEDQSLSAFWTIFRRQLGIYPDSRYIEQLCSTFPEIAAALESRDIINSNSQQKIEELVDKILEFEYMHTNEQSVLEDFFVGINEHVRDELFVKSIIKRFKGKNWFYNWIIYKLKLTLIKKLYVDADAHTTDSLLREAFQYLSYHTEPFLGKPRTSDLYRIHGYIYNSLVDGLQLVHTKEQWDYLIDVLIKVSEGTTVSLQGSISGPLATDSLFQLLTEFVCNDNIEKTIDVLVRLSKDKQDYHFHINIAEYEFTLSILYSKAGDAIKAHNHFTEAVKYALAYTFRKDASLDDVITAIDSYSLVNPTIGLDYLKGIKVLADSVLHHTDGKGTQYYTGAWFRKYLAINFEEASLYLRNELHRYIHSWIDEECLVDLLIEADGSVDAVIEGYIACTLPVERSEKFQAYCISLSKKIPEGHSVKSALLTITLSNITIEDQYSYSAGFVKKAEEAASRHKLPLNYKPKTSPAHGQGQMPAKPISILCEDRLEFADMSIAELTNWFGNGKLIRDNINALCYLFGSFNELDNEMKGFINTLIINTRKGDSDPNNVLDMVFAEHNDFRCYYLVSRFVLESGGWFQRFTRIDLFKAAHDYNPQLALTYLFELLVDQLNVGFNRDFSANLIRLLIELNYDPKVIDEMWANLFNITSYRLPNQEAIDWGDALDNSLEMNQREILFSILLCRFRANTTERYQRVVGGLVYIMKYCPDLAVKPFKWFLQNRERFQSSQILSVIQLIYNRNVIDAEYKNNFSDELNSMYPTRYATIDILIEELLHKPELKYIEVQDIQYPLKPFDKRFYLILNQRQSVFTKMGLDLDQVFAKHQSTWQHKYQHLFDIYANRYNRIMVQHIYSSEYMLELINCGYLSNQLKDWAKVNKLSFYKTASLGLDAIAAQVNSSSFRPSDIVRPWDTAGECLDDLNTSKDWILLAHFEHEYKIVNYSELLGAQNLGGITFSGSSKDNAPYLGYILHPAVIWDNMIADATVEDTPVLAFIQDDPIEYLRLLWLHPNIISALNLTISDPADGLYANNEYGEKVLKFEYWSSEYLGLRHNNHLHDEKAKLVGSALSMKKDYFDKMCKIYKYAPKYCIFNTKTKEKPELGQ